MIFFIIIKTMDIESGEVKIKVSLKTKCSQFILNHSILCIWIFFLLLLIIVILIGSSP